MQANLKALFAGRREAVELPPKARPGRPPKRKREELEERDEALVALQELEDVRSVALDHQEYDVRQPLPKRGRLRDSEHKWERPGSHCAALAELTGQPLAELRMPGIVRRSSQHEGPKSS